MEDNAGYSKPTISVIVHILLSVLIALPRIVGVKAEFYQAIAHLFVGYCIGRAFQKDSRKLFVWIVVVLSVIEVFCFLYYR